MTASNASPVDISSLPQWVQRVLTTTPAAEPAPRSILQLRGSPAWPLAIDAAMVQSFLPQELGPRYPSREEREKAENDLLDYCVVSYEPRGARWTLTPEARSDVLGALLDSEDLGDALERTGSHFTDRVSIALRSLVRRETVPDLETLDLESLEALRAAATLIGDVSSLKPMTPLAELDRAIDLCRLLAQFARMTGKSSSHAKGVQREDRFFGREDDLKRLRSFVDVAKSRSLLESLNRSVRRLPFIGRNPVAVWGLGGVGKSTLMAKFMLEHAHAAAKETRYPFAYLDFDRSALTPRNRAGLLIELTLQVGAQFPELTDQMAKLRVDARELSRRMEASSNVDSISRLSPLMWEFRGAVDRLLDSLERGMSRPRPFLLVFDTFEVVQYTPWDVVALEEFVRGFTLPDETGVWPRLRLVIAGRRAIARFLGKVEAIELRGIDGKGAEEMLKALGADYNLTLDERDVRRLIGAIAKIAGGADQGWRPLRLRLLAQVLKQMHDDAPEASCAVLVDKLIAILNDPQEGGAAFIDGILVRRILEHLHDGRVIALADPGLVVRRVTPDVIRNVMALGTPKPDLSQPISSVAASNRDDATDFTPWSISEAEAAEIFAAFKREVTLVEVDGEELWHRQDVRREMLPLIMARKNRFRLLHELAWVYYKARLGLHPGDRAATAEAIYHGLWLGKSTTELDALWPADSSFNPRIDADEFPAGDRSPVFLKLQTGAPLCADETRELTPDVALRWLKRRGSALIDEGVDESAIVVRQVLRSQPQAIVEDRQLAGNAAEALYRAGYWADALSLTMRGKISTGELRGRYLEGDPSIARLLRIAARICGKTEQPLAELEESVGGIDTSDPATTIDVNLHLGLVYRRQRGSSRGDRYIATCVRRLHEVTDIAWRSDVRLLRLAILICEGDLLARLQSIYVDVTDGLPRDPELMDVAHRVQRANPMLGQQIDDYLADQRPTFDLGFRESIMRGVYERREVAEAVRYVLAFDHRDWKHPLTNALERALTRDRSAVITPVLQNPRLRLSSRVRIDKRAEPQQARSIIDALLDGGGLLEFARSLRGVDKQFSGTAEPDSNAGPVDGERWTAYPQDLFGLAAALLRWHDALVRTVAERAQKA